MEEAIAPGEDGQVYFEGTYWRTRFYDPDCQAIAPIGSKVQVVMRDRLPLLVMPNYVLSEAVVKDDQD
ncbi:MAG: NfeD family protein [Leptolyngbyaceae cyanobacterium]